MVTVLWLLVGAAVLTMTASLAGRESVNAGRNRVLAERSYWEAHVCEAFARAAIDSVLSTQQSAADGGAIWRSLDVRFDSAQSVRSTECTARLIAAGTRLDVNAADSAALQRAFNAAGFGSSVASLVDAVLDWRDPDDVARPAGAERDTYALLGRMQPRNGPFVDVREISMVRGLEDSARVNRVLGVEPGRIAINSAPPEVLSVIPGFVQETIDRVLTHRAEGTLVSDLLDLSSELSAESREQFIANYPEIVRTASVDPEAWILMAEAHRGLPSVSAVIELRLVRSGKRAVVVRRRSW